MDVIIQLQRQLSDYTNSLYREGFLDDQFKQLQQLQDESNPDFVVEVVYLFFEDSERLISELAKTLSQQPMDFKKMDAHVHQLKGSSSSIGAQRVQKVCIAFRNYCEEQNIDGCLKCLQLLRNEYTLVKNRLETMFKMEKQVLGAGGSIPLN
ncbi:hypothetical protein M9H77_27815 [Catharanthus roseus]|uniref:Uncharacterized protein n=1 Tax=Catharanthus roseus TaxID=4058 RepID=A0ACC0ADJ9_CATRO|nr:hypothetical protein M9H77_27815 [Catharanthus roseus]